MTKSVCFNCGDMKFGAFTPCPSCGLGPHTEDQLVLSMVITDHYYEDRDLELISNKLKSGKPFTVERDTKLKFLRMIRSSDMLQGIMEANKQYEEVLHVDDASDEVQMHDSSSLPVYTAISWLITEIDQGSADPIKRGVIAQSISEYCRTSFENIINNQKVFSEYSCAKLSLECTILESASPTFQICDAQKGNRIRKMAYQMFSDAHQDMIENVRSDMPTSIILPDVNFDPQACILKYEDVFWNQGMEMFSAYFIKRVIRIVHDKPVKSVPRKKAIAMGCLLASKPFHGYWPAVFEQYTVNL